MAETAGDEHAAAAVIRQRGNPGERIVRDRQPLDSEAERAELVGEQLLGAGLLAEDHGLHHEPFEEGERVLGTGPDRQVNR